MERMTHRPEVKVDAQRVRFGLDEGARAGEMEGLGMGALWIGDAAHDPFLACLVALQHTERLLVGTGIAVAFGRSPMTVAQSAWDLQRVSGGRFVLGLGSQVRAHIERRYSMPWSQPAKRMEEYVAAVRAIWRAWQERVPLDFRGDFYQHTLMPPLMDPGPNSVPPSPIFIAAVGPAMTRVAGRVADGLLAHCFTTERYLREVTLPTLQAGASSVRPGRQVQLQLPAFVATGTDDRSIHEAVHGLKGHLAFYGSTPSYRGVLDLHGWGGLHEELHALSRRGRWSEMPSLIDDSVLETFAAVGDPAAVGRTLAARFGDVVDRITFYTHVPLNTEVTSMVMAAMSEALSQ